MADNHLVRGDAVLVLVGQVGSQDEVGGCIVADDPGLLAGLTAGQGQSLGVELGGHGGNAVELLGFLQNIRIHINILRDGGKEQVAACGRCVLRDQDGICAEAFPAQGKSPVYRQENAQHHDEDQHRQHGDGHRQKRLIPAPCNVVPNEHEHV